MTIRLFAILFIALTGLSGCDGNDVPDESAEKILLCKGDDEYSPRNLTLRFVNDVVTVIDPRFDYDLSTTLPNRDDVVWEWEIPEPADRDLYPDYSVEFVYKLNTVNGRLTFTAFDTASGQIYDFLDMGYWCKPTERMVD